MTAAGRGWAIGVETVRPVSAGAIAWRSGGDRWAVTVVVKATFSIVEDAPAELIAPAPLCREERFAAGSRGGSPLEEPDLAPYKPQADVTFVGSVHAPHPVQALRARLAVIGDDHGIDKSVQAVGDRAGAGAAPLPFRQMPLTWERTWASGDNPVGVAPGRGSQPNVLDAASPQAPAGLGPIARGWPSRASLLGAVDRRWLEAHTPELPHDFRWEYFQAAPRDQRLPRLRGSETLLLENLLEGRPRVRTRLPAVRGCARLHAAWLPGDGQLLDLVADSLAIDGDAQAFSVVWRASIPLPHADASLEGARVVTGVELPGFPMPWSSPRSGARTASSPTAAPSAATPRSSAPSMPAVPAPRSSSPSMPAVPALRSSSPGLPRLHADDEAGEGTAVLSTAAASPGPLHAPPSGIAPPLAPPSAAVGSTLALTPEEAMRLIASAPRHVPFPGDVAPPVAPPPPGRTVASTLRSPVAGDERRPLDPPTRLAIPVVAPPPPAPAGPVEEATRQMSVARILDETTATIDLGPLPGAPRPPAMSPPAHVAPPRVTPAPPPIGVAGGGTPATMALTPEQAAAMLAAAGRQRAAGGGFPPPLVAPPPPTPVGFAPGPDDDLDTSGETFALTPEQAQRMMADAAARKTGR